MKTLSSTLKPPALISSILVLPLLLLEVINRRGFQGNFPATLFGLLWLLAAACIFALPSFARGDRPAVLALRAVLALLLAGLWLGIVADQWPCFLGAPNCD